MQNFMVRYISHHLKFVLTAIIPLLHTMFPERNYSIPDDICRTELLLLETQSRNLNSGKNESLFIPPMSYPRHSSAGDLTVKEKDIRTSLY